MNTLESTLIGIYGNTPQTACRSTHETHMFVGCMRFVEV